MQKRSVSDLSSSNHFNRPKAGSRMLTPCSSSKVFASYQMSRSRFCNASEDSLVWSFFSVCRDREPPLTSLDASADVPGDPSAAEAGLSSSVWTKVPALRLTKQVENLCRLAIHDLDRADVLCPQGNVYQPVARTEIEQSSPVRQKPVSYRCSRQNVPRPKPKIVGLAGTRSSWPALRLIARPHGRADSLSTD